MTPELLATAVIVTTVAALVVLTWWLTIRLVPPEPRRLAKWLFPATVLILAVFLVGGYVASSVRHGDFLCVVCGRSTGIVSFAGMRFLGPVAIERGVGDSDQYQIAFPDEGSATHEHEWLAVGCQFSGCDLPLIPSAWAVGCTEIGACAWFRDLPRVPDRQLARACAERLRAASRRERWLLLQSYDLVADAQSDIDARFAAWRLAWRRNHPDWP